jgi:hypothetical protein
MKRKKREERGDGMQSEEIKWQKCLHHLGRHVLRISESINHVRAVYVYISTKEVSESIRRCGCRTLWPDWMGETGELCDFFFPIYYFGRDIYK